MKRLLALLAFGLLGAVTVPAMASTRAYVGVNLVLRAGPDIGYPRVTVVPAGVYVSIQGCLGDWSWCDVIIDGHRGWVAATYLQYPYNGGWVYLPSYGPQFGIPVVTFVLSTYWGNYYPHRAWYRERERWMRSPPRHPPPRRSSYYRPLPPSAHPARPVERRTMTRPAPAARPVDRSMQAPATAPRHAPARNTQQERKSQRGRERDKGRQGGGGPGH